MSAPDVTQKLWEAGRALGLEIAQLKDHQRILRIALEAIYGTPALTLAEARAIAGQALEDTE